MKKFRWVEDDYWLTDKEKQMLTNCPRCDASYGMGSSEVDADDICRVTCGQCGGMIEYQIEWLGFDDNEHNGII